MIVIFKIKKPLQRRFYFFFGGKYRYGELKCVSNILSTNKELIWKKNWSSMIYLIYVESLLNGGFISFFGGKYRYGELKCVSNLLSTNKELIWKKNWSSILSMWKVSWTAVFIAFFGSKYRYGKLNHLSIKCYICGDTFKKIVTWIITLEN